MIKKSKDSKEFDKHALIQAAAQVGCTDSQAEDLWKLLHQDKTSMRWFDSFNAIYYLGGLIIFCALAWFLGKSHQLYGETSFFLISLGYVLGFYAIGIYLWKIKQKEVLGGITLFLSLSLVPLATYAFQTMLEYWPHHSIFHRYSNFSELISGGWILMDITTLISTLVTFYFIRFPLLTVLLYSTLWHMCDDILPLFIGARSLVVEMGSIDTWIRIGLGCSIMTIAFLLDRANKKSFAFWGYLFGVGIFWYGITVTGYKTEWGYTIYCVLNALLFSLGAIFKRRVFIVFGVLGIVDYLVELVYRHFSTSSAFPFILSLAGIAVIIFGILFQRYYKKITLRLSHQFASRKR